jgi:hypothetical protein
MIFILVRWLKYGRFRASCEKEVVFSRDLNISPLVLLIDLLVWSHSFTFLVFQTKFSYCKVQCCSSRHITICRRSSERNVAHTKACFFPWHDSSSFGASLTALTYFLLFRDVCCRPNKTALPPFVSFLALVLFCTLHRTNWPVYRVGLQTLMEMVGCRVQPYYRIRHYVDDHCRFQSP